MTVQTADVLVVSVQPRKSGTSPKGRAWTLYDVVGKTDAGETMLFKTWDGEWKNKQGQRVTVQYEETTSPQGYKGKMIVEDRKPRGRGGFPVGPVMDVLARLESKVDMLCDAVHDLRGKP